MNDEEDDVLLNTMDDEQNAKKQRKQEKQEGQNTLFGRVKQNAKEQAKEKTKETAKREYQKYKKAKKVAKKAGKVAGGAAKVANPVGATVFLIILIIIIIIGIISFITSMPGLVQQEIMKKVMGAKDLLSYTLGGSDYYLTDLATSEEGEKYRKDVLKYLNDMGLDPAGFGFAPFFRVNSDGEVEYDTSIAIDDVPGVHELFSALVANWKAQKRIENQDLIFKYLVSNERTYLVDDDSKATKVIEKLGVTPIYESLFGSTKLKGMIKMRLEGGLGNDQWHTFTVDRENQQLIIATANLSETKFKLKEGEDGFFKKALKSGLVGGVIGSFIGDSDVAVDVPIQMATYDLSSYAGRYGTPLEMLLALHLATMTSDLTDEMVTNENLQTELSLKVKLDSYDTDYEVSYNGKTLPAKIGDYGFAEPDMHEYIYYDDDNVARVTAGSERAGITIRSLRNWANKITQHKNLNLAADQQTVRAIEAKNALLGNGEFYIDYRMLENIGDLDVRDAMGLRKGTSNDAIYIGPAEGISNNGNIILHGLPYYINGNEKEIRNDEYTRNGITYILSQLDACLVYEELELISNYEFNEDNLLLAQQWMDFISDESNLTDERIHEELVNLSKNVTNYFDIIEHKEEKMQNVIDSYLGVHLTPDDLQAIINSAKDLPGEYEFAMPRIEHVIKHWYKDVIFENKNIDGVYDSSSEAIRAPISDIETTNGDKIQITAILTDGKAYSQTGQPYVVKGDVVTLDGEVVEDSGVENLTFSGGYKVGDGYRTTKKLFTQGQYYIFDGSRETSQSIYYAKELEKLKPNSNNEFAIVHVQNGRISILNSAGVGGNPLEIIGDSYSAGQWNTSTQFVGDKRIKANLGSTVINDENGNWSVFLAKAYDSGANIYYVKANADLKYLSPADYTYEESKKSVEKINSLLEAMGVVTIRKPISFDNTTANGEITTLTAFEILEGMHTEAAEDVYKDLKEMLIELGYFSKAEFDQISTNVLDWFIPDYTPRSKQWRQNREEDDLYYGAILYPASMTETTDSENDSENTEIGFEPDLDVIAPGNARIKELRDDGITLVFDGISEPEIGALDKYSMSIDGIVIDRNAVVNVIDSNGEESEMSLQSVFESEGKYIVKVGEIIGHTGNTKIQVILKNSKEGYIDNIEDYMAPALSATPVVSASDEAYFYFSPYEGRPESVGGRNGNEVAVGICQWTTINGSYNNISPFCKWLVEQDASLCGELETFVYWTAQDFVDDYYGAGQLKKAFEKVNYRDSTKFRQLQETYAKNEKEQIIRNLGLGWVLEKNPVTAGTLFSLVNWGPYMGWENQIDQSMSDEQIIKALLKYACTKNSTAGSLNARWESQAKLAIDILYGNFTDISGWRANPAQYPQYGQGNNAGYLTK